MIRNMIKLLRKRNDFYSFLRLSFYRSLPAWRSYHQNKAISLNLWIRTLEKTKGQGFFKNYLQTHDFTADVLIQICYDLKDQPVNKTECRMEKCSFY